MARQKGIIKLEGTIGDINFYIRNGEAFARKAGGGFTAKSIKTSPTMIGVRENNSEFGNCSSLKKHFNQALRPFLMDYKDGSLQGRLMRRFQQIKVHDEISERGQRLAGIGISTPIGKHLLKEFEFISGHKDTSFLKSTISFCVTNLSFQMPALSGKDFLFPNNATHLEITLGILHFNFLDYSHYWGDVSKIVLEKESAINESNYNIEIISGETGHSIAVFGLRYFQEIGGIHYPLKGNGCIGFGIVAIF